MTDLTITQDILVVKIGGGAGLDMRRCARDLAQLAAQRPVVVVHGVSDALNRLCDVRGIPVRTITSPTGHTSRYTDAQTRDLFVEAAQSVNCELVSLLAEYGADAVSLDTPIYGERKTSIRAVVDGRIRVIRDDYTGTISGVNADAIYAVLASGRIPVIAPLANSDDGLLNIDGDRGAAAVAAALNAAELVILSNVRGLYRQFGNEDSFVARVAQSGIETALDWAQGRMKRKVIGAQEALNGGVRRVMIADGRVDEPVMMALNGMGTTFEGRA